MNCLLIALVLNLVSCSKEVAPPARIAKANVMLEYLPTFTLVKIQDGFMQKQGVSYSATNGYDFGSIENRYKVAGYVLANPGECSFTTLTGNFVPVVWSHQQTHVELNPDFQQEERDLNTYGMKVTYFHAGVEVRDEDDKGNVGCTWRFGFGVHTKEPIGNSTDHGGTDSLGGGISPVGKPDMRPLFQCKGSTLWAVVVLNRK